MNKIKFRPEEPQRESFIYDDYWGETVYESDNLSLLLRRRDEMVFNIYAPKSTNWKQLAELINDECWAMSFWAQEQRKTIKNFEDLPAVEYPAIEVELGKTDAPATPRQAQDEPNSGHADDDEYDEDEETLYMLTWADGYWEMYESDEDYLIRYRLPKCEVYPLVCPDDLDALQFLIRDEMWKITSFLRGTYDRVNGYPDNDDDNAEVYSENEETGFRLKENNNGKEAQNV